MLFYLRSRGVTRVLEDSSGNAGDSPVGLCRRSRNGLPHPRAGDRLLPDDRPDRGLRCRRGDDQGLAAGRGGGGPTPECGDLLCEPQLAAVLRGGHQDARLRAVGAAGLSRARQSRGPLGCGSNVLGAERGFGELLRRGAIERRPRLFGVQAAHCAPYQAAFLADGDHLVATSISTTVAQRIAMPKPTRVAEVPRAVREWGGRGGGGERGGDRGGPPGSGPSPPLRGAYLRHRGRRALVPPWRRRHPRPRCSCSRTSGLETSATTGELLGLYARGEDTARADE